jgi:hypothetical protein
MSWCSGDGGLESLTALVSGGMEFRTQSHVFYLRFGNFIGSRTPSELNHCIELITSSWNEFGLLTRGYFELNNHGFGKFESCVSICVRERVNVLLIRAKSMSSISILVWSLLMFALVLQFLQFSSLRHDFIRSQRGLGDGEEVRHASAVIARLWSAWSLRQSSVHTQHEHERILQGCIANYRSPRLGEVCIRSRLATTEQHRAREWGRRIFCRLADT